MAIETALPETEPVRRLPVPPQIRALSTLARVDYADTFLVDVGRADRLSAEAWARAVLEDAPLRTRTALLSGWTSLGLKLAPRDPDAVLGWRIHQGAADSVLLAAGGRLGIAAELLFRRERGALRFATFVQHDGPAARLAWAGVERVHDPVVRSVLARASRRAAA